jgi:hypothetical protein
MQKKAMVTGASEGIGRSFAIQLKDAGYTVTAVARNEIRLKGLIEELGGAPHSYIVADLSLPGGSESVSAQLKNGGYGVLVNCAGLGTFGHFRDMEAGAMSAMIGVNCTSLVDLSRAFLAQAKSGDSLINVSSGACYLPMPVASLYTGTKGFVTAFSEALWYEERKRGVYVVALCPGLTITKFHERAGGTNDQLPMWLSQTPRQVAAIGIKAIRKRSRPVVICGFQGPVIKLSYLLPRKWVVWLSGKSLDATF